jgi:Cu(I)/Ag(I) efflux system periplasmic protein CusF
MLMFPSKLPALLAALALTGPAAVQAQAGPGAAPARQPGTSAPQWQGALARGEILEIDRKESRVLVRHGPIPNLGMDPMTMEFWVPDAKLLASLQPGDKMRFAAGRQDGEFVITRAQVIQRRGTRR